MSKIIRPILTYYNREFDTWENIKGEGYGILGHYYETVTGARVRKVVKTESWVEEAKSPSATVGTMISDPDWSFIKKFLFWLKNKSK